MKNVLFFLILVAPNLQLMAQKSIVDSWQENFSKGSKFKEEGNYASAVKPLSLAYHIASKNFKKQDPRIYETELQLGENYKYLGEYEKAKKFYQEGLALVENQISRKSAKYGIWLSNFAGIYRETDQLDQALSMSLEAISIIEKSVGKDKAEYGEALENLAYVYESMGKLDKALPLYIDILKNTEINFGKEHQYYAYSLGNLGTLYLRMNQYDKALPYLIQATEMTKKLQGENHPEYGAALNTLAALYRETGQYEKALELSLKSVGIAKESLGEFHQLHGSYLVNLAVLYQNLGQYDKALSNFLLSKEIIAKTLGVKSSEYAVCSAQLADLYKITKQFAKAIQLYLESIDLLKKTLGEDHNFYGQCVGNLANLYVATKAYDLASPLYSEALVNYEKNFGKDNSEYGNILNNVAFFYEKTGQYDKAFSLYDLAIKIEENTKGTQTPGYRVRINNIAALEFIRGHLEEAEKYYIVGNQLLADEIEKIFIFNSELEKKAFLKTIYKNYDVYQSFGSDPRMQSTEVVDMNMNNEFLIKGILMNSSKDIIGKLLALNDDLLTEKVYSLRAAKSNLSKQLSLNLKKQSLNTDSIKNKINSLEASLAKIYSEKFHQDKEIVKDWKKIRSKLHNDEVAIEFSHFVYWNPKGMTDSILTIAYVIKKSYLHPKVITLFEEKQLKALLTEKSPDRLYATRGATAKSASGASEANAQKLYNLIWKPIEKEIGDAKTIYYAPDGLLHQIPFAALRDGKKNLAKKYNLMQLSSTGIIANGFTEPLTDNALFIGGINYDYQPPDTKSISPKTYAYLENPTLNKNKSTRGGSYSWNYLPGTLKEIEGIESLFIIDKKSYKMLSADLATESAFKSLSGHSPKILHIATHGFFFENLPDEKSGSENPYKASEDPLMRSGLMLAHSNYAWGQGSNPYEEEDGILTSMEISNLDLSKTDMVVLSACDTGLGDIDGSEGVYGLQRAFKMAGVKIIVMSLWQVPDAETAEFMKLFYGHWLKGVKVREAFNKAQKTMMKRYKTEPLKWAGFVMFE